MSPASNPLKVGIINPDWTPMRHNTDHVCVMDFAGMPSHARDVQMGFVGNRLHYLGANANLAFSRLVGRPLIPNIPLRVPAGSADVLYQYGNAVNGLRLHGRSHPPLMMTVGYPSLGQVIARGKPFMDGEAAKLEAATSRSSAVHFHTDCMRELYLERKPQHAERCVTIPFYLPQLTVLSEAQVHRKFDQAETLLLFVGADGQRKGLAELCGALDLIAEELQQRRVRAVIVSKHAPTCTRFSAVQHLPSLPRSEVQTLMQQAHIYCMVPRYESFGLVFVEAMAAGCAVIGDDDLPRQEILDHGRCGMLLPAHRSEPQAEALLELLSDRTHMRGMALAGLARAQARYAPAKVARAYADAFHHIAG